MHPNQLHLMGGADEIGASSGLIDLLDTRVVIDAGLRHKRREGSNLPSWAALEARPPDVIVLTHAHLDHSGALPLLHARFPEAPIYMTAPTLRLITLMLEDSLKIMKLECEAKGEVPLFDREALDATLAAVRPLDFGEQVRLDGDEGADTGADAGAEADEGAGADEGAEANKGAEAGLWLAFEPAGHILGAGIALFRSPEGDLAFSGDIAATPQLTIPGMSRRALDVDLLLVESTYGGRFHKDRAGEERRIVEQAREVLEAGGSILFPAFAIGRAQEIILILSRAIEAGELPEVPIFIDGLVRQVCMIYSLYPEHLSPWLRERCRRRGNPFWGGSGPVVPIWDPAKREQMIKSAGAKLIVASSGMLIGGPSALYARFIARDPKSMIAITGYQDEESPGRAVQDLAREGGGTLLLPDGPVELRCQVSTYGLSAHVDTREILDFAERSGAAQVVLVHGEGETRPALAEALKAQRAEREVILPALTSSIPFCPSEARRRRRRAGLRHDGPLGTDEGGATEALVQGDRGAAASAKHTGASQRPPHAAAPLDCSPEALLTAATALLEQGAGLRQFSIQEIARTLGARGRALSPDRLIPLLRSLEDLGSPFRRHKTQRTQYALRVAPDGQLITRGEKGPKGPSTAPPKHDLNQLREQILAAFPEDDRPYKVGFPSAGQRAQLRFHFPLTAELRHQDALDWLRPQLPLPLELNPNTHHEALARLVLDLIPKPWRDALIKAPSLHLDRAEVSLRLALPAVEDWALSEVSEALAERAGFTLSLRCDAAAPRRPVVLASDGTTRALAAAPEGELLYTPPAESEPLFHNVAVKRVRAACTSLGLPLKAMRPSKGRLTLVVKRPTLSEAQRAGLVALGEEIRTALWVVLGG